MSTHFNTKMVETAGGPAVPRKPQGNRRILRARVTLTLKSYEAVEVQLDAGAWRQAHLGRLLADPRAREVRRPRQLRARARQLDVSHASLGHSRQLDADGQLEQRRRRRLTAGASSPTAECAAARSAPQRPARTTPAGAESQKGRPSRVARSADV